MKIDELNAIKDKMKNQVTLRAEDPDSTKVLVAMGTCGIAAGARDVLKAEKHLIGGQVVSEYTI